MDAYRVKHLLYWLDFMFDFLDGLEPEVQTFTYNYYVNHGLTFGGTF